MAGPNEDAGGSVIIKLTADDNIKDLHKRTIALTQLNDTLQIGRASKVATKGFVAATDNAWFDSPVMSRNHAEIVADVDKKAVYIRDIGSLHGTFINHSPDGIKTNQLVELRDGFRVTFGVPIWRNAESFAPATVKVGITHDPGRRPSPAAGSTFALPEYVDDESSSSDDDLEEIEDIEEDLLVSDTQGPGKPTIVDLTEGQPQVDIVDLTDREMPVNMDHTADRLIDLTSPPRAESPGMEVEEETERDLQVLQATALILDKIVDNRPEPDRDDSDIGSPLSEDSESLNLSDETDSTDSEVSMEDVEDDHSDDDEGSNSDDEKAEWDAEYSSDDDVLDPDDPDTAIWPPVEEPVIPPVIVDHGLNRASSSAKHDDTIPLDATNAPPDHPFAFAGPYPVPYFPASENAPVFAPARVTLPSLLNPEARQASPSDAALPKRTINIPSVLPLGGGSTTAEVLGEKTGKYEYFAAREQNRLRTFAPFRLSPVPLMNDGWARSADYSKHVRPEVNPTVTEKPGVSEEPTVPEKDTVVGKHVPSENLMVAEKQQAIEKPAAPESQPPTKPAPADIPKTFATSQTVIITPLLRTGDNFLNRPQSSADFQLPTYPGDDTDEPISAYELQKRKMAAQKQLDTITYQSNLTDDTRRTHVGISDIVDVSPASAPEPERRAPVVGRGKRKADDMVELTAQEVQWEFSESKLMRHLRAANESMLRHAPMNDDDLPATHAEALICEPQKGRRLTPLPELQAHTINISQHVEPVSDVRAPKRLRLRKIAERLGYAALGGATVGAALVSTLIYTAPTFT